MKKILWACLACLLCAGAAQAASLRIGDESIGYNVPQGYMAGDQGPYLEIRKFLAEISPKDMQILALYVDEKSHGKFVDAHGRRLDRYFIISTLRPLADKSLSLADFAQVKKGIAQAQEQLKTTLKEKINNLLGKAGQSGLSVREIDALGVFHESDTSLSFMMVVDQVGNADGRPVADTQAVASTYLLAQGKLVMVNQYRLLNPAENTARQLSAAKVQAQKILEELAFKQGEPGTWYPETFLGKVLLAAVMGAVIGGLIGWLAKRKRKEQHPA